MSSVRYRLPGEGEQEHHITGHSRIVSVHEDNWPEGFVMRPFHITPQCPFLMICEGEDDGTDSGCNLPLHEEQNYPEVFQYFHSHIGEGKEFRKLVLSHPFRCMGMQKETLYNLLKEKYPNALVYWVESPIAGCWIGATPEVLLEGSGKQWRTMALAGTKTREEEWDIKNREEQSLVASFIMERLLPTGISVEASSPHTYSIGTLQHLCTDFDLTLPEHYSMPALLRILHPTPAVCGVPQREAMHFILRHEGYDRRYYAGIVGPYHPEGDTRLHVNIRCTQFYGDGSAYVYAGSGLMPDSTAMEEWAEINRKKDSVC